MNSVTVSQLKCQGLAVIETNLSHGPVRITRYDKSVAVVLSEEDYLALSSGEPRLTCSMTALQWLLTRPACGTLSKEQLRRRLSKLRS